MDVLVLERATTGSGSTGRSPGFVRMHYDLALALALRARASLAFVGATIAWLLPAVRA